MIIHRYKIPVLAVALCVLATATAAHADGTGFSSGHGCQTTITNNTSVDLEVRTYNSNDAVCVFGHMYYDIEPGATETVKAHSQGQSHCKIKIEHHGTRMCVNHWCTGARITKTAGKQTSFEVNGTNDCPPVK